MFTNFRFSLFAVFVNEVSLGIAYGWTAPTIRQLQNATQEIHIDNEQSSWLASSLELGRMFSPLLTCFLVDIWGRKVIFSACISMCFISWFLLIFTTSVEVICAARLFFGISVGMWDVCTGIYIGENSRPQLRAIIGSVGIASFYAGELTDFVLATYFPYKTVILVNMALSFLALFSILLVTESPHYLIMKGSYEKAEKTFNWLTGVGSGATVPTPAPTGFASDDNEFAKLKRAIVKQVETKLTVRELLTTPLYYRTIAMVLGLCTLMTLTGFNAVTAFVSIAFTGSEIFTPYQFTILYGLLQFSAVGVSSIFIEKFERKSLLRFSLVLITLAQASTALLYYVNENVAPVPYFPWLIFVTITLYSMVYSAGMHPIFYVIRGEVFPQKIKPIGGCIGVMGNSFVSFLSTVMFLEVAEVYGIYVNFLIFAIFSLVAIFYVHFLVPETRGKTLIEIQDSMMGTTSKLHSDTLTPCA